MLNLSQRYCAILLPCGRRFSIGSIFHCKKYFSKLLTKSGHQFWNAGEAMPVSVQHWRCMLRESSPQKCCNFLSNMKYI